MSQKLSREERLYRLKQEFRTMDINQDGSIHPSELLYHLDRKNVCLAGGPALRPDDRFAAAGQRGEVSEQPDNGGGVPAAVDGHGVEPAGQDREERQRDPQGQPLHHRERGLIRRRS